MSTGSQTPSSGLYDPRFEHDSCGVGFVASIKGVRSHEIVRDGLKILDNLTHRGAVGADPKAGDGAGILLQIADDFFRHALEFELPKQGEYAIGMVFLPREEPSRAHCQHILESFIEAEEQVLLGWRDVPVNNANLGESVIPTEPVIRQVFVGRGRNAPDQDTFERKLFVICKQVEKSIRESELMDRSDFYTLPLCLRVSLPTRECCWRVRWASITRICWTRAWRLPWPWCTRDSPPIPFPPGNWRIRSG